MWPLRRKTRHATWERVPKSHAASSMQTTTTELPPIAERRTYVAEVPYLLPKDAQEDQRLNFQHYVLQKVVSNHYLAPIFPQGSFTILDVGTGTGIWPLEMAVLFPQAHILGVDVALSSLPHPIPGTCMFAHANILDGLPFPDQQFNYTHQRLLSAAIPAARWPGVVRELVRVTRPGGWLELLEIGDTIQHAGPATKRLLAWMAEVGRELGFDGEVLRHLGDLLTQAGCYDVESQDIFVPLGAWAGPAGQMMKTNLLHGYDAVKGLFCPRAKTPPELFDEMVQAAVAEWEQDQAMYVFHAAYGRRKAL